MSEAGLPSPVPRLASTPSELEITRPAAYLAEAVRRAIDNPGALTLPSDLTTAA